MSEVTAEHAEKLKKIMEGAASLLSEETNDEVRLAGMIVVDKNGTPGYLKLANMSTNASILTLTLCIQMLAMLEMEREMTPSLQSVN